MPSAEREPRNPYRNSEKRNAGSRDQQQCREQPRNVELKSRKQNLVGQTSAAAAGPGDKLGDDGADQREPARDAEAAEEIRQCAGNAQPSQDLPARRATQTEELLELRVRASQP